MARLTRKAISKAINEKHGIDVEVIQGEGYFYLSSDNKKADEFLCSLHTAF